MTRHLLRFVLALFPVMLLGGCGPIVFTIGGDPQDMRLRTKVVSSDGGVALDRVAIVDVAGLIYNAHRPELLRKGDNPLSVFKEKLEAAKSDSRVKAVLLRLNTPGGTVTASDAMYREVLRFKQETNKPVVALMMDVAASGGYYLACSADTIVAYPTTITGSIGVIVQTISVKPALERWGIMPEAITSGPNKDVGSPLSELSPEHRAVLQGLVDDFYARFTSVVRERRPIPEDRFARVTDGRILSGEQALDVGLVDQVGDLYDAFTLAKKLAGIERAELVVFHRPLEYVGSAYAMTRSPVGADASPDIGTQINVAQFNLPDMLGEPPVGFYYLWAP